MFAKGWRPTRHGEWIDAYNKSSNLKLAGTIALQTIYGKRQICSDRIMTLPFNTEYDGTSRTINSQYFKMGAANVLDLSLDGANFKATGAIVIYE